MFIPITKSELNNKKWTSLDIILVTGDTYIDSLYIGLSILGKLLINNGFRVAIIAQPDISNKNDIMRLVEPNVLRT